MRLNPFNTGNINVSSSRGGGLPGGKAGGLGCGTIILAAIGYFVFGLDPMQTAATVESVQQQSGSGSQTVNTNEQEVCTASQYATEACNALDSLNTTWSRTFQEQGFGSDFQQPALRLFSNSVSTEGCGGATSAAGPFYCPANQTIYIDTGFYVIAHEYGHHIQTLTGIANSIRSAQQQNPRRANQLQVLMELQADCYAGVWAGKNRNLIEPGDIEEGMQAAAAIGDDRLTGGRVSSENFTHGTSPAMR